MTSLNSQQPLSTSDGLDFLIVGDYGWIQDLGPSNAVFDVIEKTVSQKDFDFIATVGDNIYPIDGSNPTDEEFGLMLGLFSSRENLNKIPINVVRGNHDSYFDTQREAALS
jgi:hypothetical protein